MSWETALRQRLIVDPAVDALIGKKGGAVSIDWTVRVPGAPMPAIVLTTISDPRPQTLEGLQGNRQSRVQVDVLASDRAACAALREAAIAALLPGGAFYGAAFGRAMVGSVTDRSQNTDTGFVHRDQFDVLVWHD